jgi:hypothetical protein
LADKPLRPLRLLARPVAIVGQIANLPYKRQIGNLPHGTDKMPVAPVATSTHDSIVLPFGDQHEVAQTWGPERIETGWWRGRPAGRDYYRVETSAGRRFWIFRRLRDDQWFVHGVFD